MAGVEFAAAKLWSSLDALRALFIDRLKCSAPGSGVRQARMGEQECLQAGEPLCCTIPLGSPRDRCAAPRAGRSLRQEVEVEVEEIIGRDCGACR